MADWLSAVFPRSSTAGRPTKKPEDRSIAASRSANQSAIGGSGASEKAEIGSAAEFERDAGEFRFARCSLLLAAPERGCATHHIGTALRPRRYQHEHATLAAKEPGDLPRVNQQPDHAGRIDLRKGRWCRSCTVALFRDEKGGFRPGERTNVIFWQARGSGAAGWREGDLPYCVPSATRWMAQPSRASGCRPKEKGRRYGGLAPTRSEDRRHRRTDWGAGG